MSLKIAPIGYAASYGCGPFFAPNKQMWSLVKMTYSYIYTTIDPAFGRLCQMELVLDVFPRPKYLMELLVVAYGHYYTGESGKLDKIDNVLDIIWSWQVCIFYKFDNLQDSRINYTNNSYTNNSYTNNSYQYNYGDLVYNYSMYCYSCHLLFIIYGSR